MSAPRIDTTRNMLDGLILLLAEFRAEVHDIHDLAYNRPRAADEAKVAGGSRDYALDTNGDMIARRLYIHAATTLVRVEGPVSDAIAKIRSHLTAGGSVSGYDKTRTAPKAEVAAAIRAAERRRGRARTTPVETEPHHLIAHQPPLAYQEPTEELDNLRSALRKTVGRAKPDRSRLTPAEQDAWRRAVAGEQAKAS